MKTIKKIYDWLYEKYLDWQLKRVYPNGVSEEQYQEVMRSLYRKTKKNGKIGKFIGYTNDDLPE